MPVPPKLLSQAPLQTLRSVQRLEDQNRLQKDLDVSIQQRLQELEILEKKVQEESAQISNAQGFGTHRELALKQK